MVSELHTNDFYTSTISTIISQLSDLYTIKSGNGLKITVLSNKAKNTHC